jgi:hypothetical protein
MGYALVGLALLLALELRRRPADRVHLVALGLKAAGYLLLLFQNH